MRGSRSCNDPELFRKVKEGVTMQQVAESYGLKPDRRGFCLCPFHPDKHPSLKLYPDGRGFYCFTCGAGGDPITFVARYREISNTAAARELAAMFSIPLQVPVTYREKREAELAARRRKAAAKWAKRALMEVTVYRGLLCQAIRERNEHFEEGLRSRTWAEYMMEQLRENPEAVYADRKAVRKLGELQKRINDWYIRIEPDGTISR